MLAYYSIMFKQKMLFDLYSCIALHLYYRAAAAVAGEKQATKKVPRL